MEDIRKKDEAVFLTKEQCMQAGTLWREVFYEDSESFTAYYFKEKMGENTGFGVFSEGKLCAMLFLTPYEGRILSEGEKERFRTRPLSYIVGVGTKKEYRRQGYMGKLLQTAFRYMWKEKKPFTFLMPANEAIYLPYQFRYIYDRPVFCIRENPTLPAAPAGKEDMQALADFANEYLERNCQFFLKRDARYYERLQKELFSQNGNIFLWKKEDTLAGYYLYAKEGEQAEIQEAFLSEACQPAGVLLTKEAKKPVIMARIIHAEEMLSLMRTRKDVNVTLSLKITDSLIPENEGVYLWHISKKWGSAKKLSGGKEEMRQAEDWQLETEVSLLTEFLFGRKPAEACFQARSGREPEILEKVKQIRPVSKSVINEIV